jgi:hypothetical protein
MKPFYKRGVLAAVVLAALGRGAQAQNSPYGAPSVLPLPEVRTAAPVAYQTVAPTDTLGGYRQALTANQEPVNTPPPTLNTPSDVPDGTAATIGNSVGGQWWNPFSYGATGGACGTGCGCRGCGVGTSNLWYNPCGGGWYASFGALGMNRGAPNPFWTTASSTVNADQYMNTKQAGYGLWGPGGQTTLGKWWCPCNTGCGTGCGPQYMFGVQFVYWQLADMNSSVAVNNSNFGYNSAINFIDAPTVNNGAGHNLPPDYFFDGTEHQKIVRTDRFLNIEINALVQPIYNNPGCFSATLLAGFRYFRFQDNLTYGSASGGYNFGDQGGAQEAYIQSNVTNNLFGGQIGTLLNFAVTPTWGLYAIPKFGVFGNQINITNRSFTGDGASFYNIHASGTVGSLMGELDTGAYWWVTPNCQAYLGWRVIGLSQVALADNQFLPYFADAAGFATVKSNGDMILTGGFAGFSFMF